MCPRLIAVLLHAILAQEKFHSNTLSDSEEKTVIYFPACKPKPKSWNKSYMKLMTVIRVW